MSIMTTQQFDLVKATLVGKKFPLLSEGYVELIDAMGSDARIVEAARTTSDVGAKTQSDDVNLIRYLLRHRHGTPFEFPHVALKVVCPMDTWRQWIRHRTANVNEFSSRYSVVPDRFDKTPPEKWRKQATTNRQGSSGEFVTEFPADYKVVNCDDEYFEVWGQDPVGTIDGKCRTFGMGEDGTPPTVGEYLSAREGDLHAFASKLYQERIHCGVAKEQARKDLPLSTYTEAYWQMDLRNLLGFLSLRMDSHAQLEIRSYANVIGEEIIAKLYPVTWQAFLDYDFNSMRLTALDKIVIQNLVNHAGDSAAETAATTGFDSDADALRYMPPYPIAAFMASQHKNWMGLEKCRERDECLAKLQQLGLVKVE